MTRPLVLLSLMIAIACTPAEQPAAQTAHGEEGKALAVRYGCGICHVIPGIETAKGRLGPSLEGVASRPAIAYGSVRNTPENLARYIENPGAMYPQSSMPALGLPPDDVQKITAYLLTLR